MTDKIELEQPPHRVAYDLAMMVARAEGKIVSTTISGDREYWFNLYAQCRKVVIGGASAERALKRAGTKSDDDEDDPPVGLRG